MQELSEVIDTYVTIEPILDFNIGHMVTMIKRCNPKQINIGADTRKCGLPEPDPGKLMDLISSLKEITTVQLKPILKLPTIGRKPSKALYVEPINQRTFFTQLKQR
jgi:hypothetical protein